MKTKFSKLFVTILIVAAVTCCGALGVFAADDTADTTAAASSSETVNTDNDHNSSLSIGLVAAALATGLAGIGGGMAVAQPAQRGPRSYNSRRRARAAVRSHTGSPACCSACSGRHRRSCARQQRRAPAGAPPAAGHSGGASRPFRGRGCPKGQAVCVSGLLCAA